MAYNYQYSKAFSKNGAPVAPVKFTDLLVASVAVPVSAAAPWGYKSVDKNLQALQKYVINEINSIGIGGLGLLKPGGGIVGAGTTDDPLRVDTTWTDARYMPSDGFPISQVGDPSDFILPINGSYFSVCYPLGAVMPATAYVEGNGDLRLLHQVTNGEDIRPVYALWKDYKNTSINTMQITDVPYSPPGMVNGEFVQCVYPASESAMIAEVWRGNNFQEHILILLNGTMVSQYHQVVRLGGQLFTQLMGSPTVNYPDLLLMRAHGVSAIQGADGLITIAWAAPPNHVSNNAFVSILMATGRVNESGAINLSPMTNTSATNTTGSVVANGTLGFILHRDFYTLDPENIDALYLGENNLSFFAGYSGVSPAVYGCFSGLAPDGRLIYTTRHYQAVTRNAGAHRDLKPIYYHLVDPNTRTLVPHPSSVGKRIKVGLGSGISVSVTGGNTRYSEGHYWASGNHYQILNDGSRMIHGTPVAADIFHYLSSFIGSSSSAYEACMDDVFAGAPASVKNQLRYLDPITPTPVIPRSMATIMYDNMITSNVSPQGNQLWNTRVRTRLLGNPSAKTYQVIASLQGGAPTSVEGYELTNDRTVCSMLDAVPFAFIKNNTPYYHTGYWVAGQPYGGRQGRYQLTDLQESAYDYYLDPSMHELMDQLKTIVAIPDGYTEVASFSWNIVGPYPGVGKQRCVARYLISWRVANPDKPSGYDYTGLHMGTGVLNCTTVTEDGGHVRLDWFDFNALTKTPSLKFAAMFCPPNVNHLGNSGGVCRENEDGSWDMQWNLGGNVSSLSDTGWAGWETDVINIAPDNTIVKHIDAPNNRVQRSVWHSTLGYGYIENTAGLGALYMFIPTILETGQLDNSRPRRILGSSRPAAGFSITVSAAIPVYVNGAMKTIKPQLVDLRDTKPDARWTTFYVSALVSSSDEAELYITLSPLADTENRIYLGKIVTNETEISEMVLEPVTRWEGKRVSIEALGSAIIASTGFPGAPGSVAAVSAGIDPTQSQGIVSFDATASTVRVDVSGAFFVQDKNLAIARFGNFEQIEVTGNVNKGTVWLNGVSIWSGSGVDNRVINRNDLIKEGWNTISSQYGRFIMRGPFLKRNK